VPNLKLKCSAELPSLPQTSTVPCFPTPAAHFNTSGSYTVPSAPPKSIVIVDDEPLYTKVITRLLAENIDCPLHSFSRPSDALAALPTLNPAVVVTDYYMPDLNGLEFTRSAAPLVPDAVFLLISGQNLSGVRPEIDHLPMIKSVLAKPFAWRTLAAEILRVWPKDSPAPAARTNSPVT
jgi:CheY-like chemotaxis protein